MFGVCAHANSLAKNTEARATVSGQGDDFQCDELQNSTTDGLLFYGVGNYKILMTRKLK